MSLLTVEPSAARQPIPAAWPSDPQRLLLHDLSWQAYRAIGEALAERAVRLTFDRGRLEFMTLSPEHERWKGLLRRLISHGSGASVDP